MTSLICSVVLAAMMAAQSPSSSTASAGGALPLFDGQTLKGWRILKDGAFSRPGKVSVDNGVIVLAKGDLQTGIGRDGPFPRDNYEVSLEAMRFEGSDFFCGMTFPVGDSPCTLIVGGWGGCVVGLSNVDHDHAAENMTTTSMTFENNRWYHLRLRVTSERIQVWINDKDMIDLARENHKFTVWTEQEPAKPFGIATWDTGARLRNITLRSLNAASAQPVAVTSAVNGVRNNYIVATNGNDRWSGTLAAPNDDGTDGPFATIRRAQEAVRAARRERVRPYAVLVRGGTYRLVEPLVFKPEDSGTVEAPIIYMAYPGERAVLSGGRPIGDWKKGDGSLWTTQVSDARSDDGYFTQLFVNGRRCTRARTPNEGYLNIEDFLPEVKDPHKEKDNPAVKLGFRFKDGELKRWENLEDVNIFLYHSWTASLHWIKSLDEQDRLVRFTAPCGWPIGYWGPRQRYVVENYREALDAPGEWYLDRKTGILSYWPREDEDMGRMVAEAPRLRKLLVLDGDIEKGMFVEHLRFEGLSFQYATWFVTDKGEADGQAAAWLEAAIFARGARYCLLEDCEITHVGEYGLHFEQGCRDNMITGCHIHDLGAGGARIGHQADPRNDHGVTERNTIDNCFIHDGGSVFPAGVGVWIGRSSYNMITHNEIADFYYTGISVGWSWGYAPSSAHHNMIEYNHVHDIGQGVLSDMGGIYTLGVSPGTVIRHNVFHDVSSFNYGGWGLYTDEGSTGILLENNIVYNTKTGGFHQHYGRENTVRNNIFAFSREGQIQRSREEEHLSFTFERNIVYFDNKRLFSGNWGKGRYQLDYNLYWDTSGPDIKFVNQDFAAWQAMGNDRHSIIADPKFVDVARCDFRFQPDSPALKLGFVPIDTSKVGLYGDPKWIGLPASVNRKSQTGSAR